MRDKPRVISNRMWALHVAGIVARLRGDAAAAVQAQTDSLALIGPGPRALWDRVRALAERGLASLDGGRFEDATTDLEEAKRLFETLGTSMHPAQAEVLVGLARLAIGHGDAETARPLLEEASRFWERFEPGSAGEADVARWLEQCALTGRSRLRPDAIVRKSIEWIDGATPSLRGRSLFLLSHVRFRGRLRNQRKWSA